MENGLKMNGWRENGWRENDGEIDLSGELDLVEVWESC